MKQHKVVEVLSRPGERQSISHSHRRDCTFLSVCVATANKQDLFTNGRILSTSKLSQHVDSALAPSINLSWLGSDINIALLRARLSSFYHNHQHVARQWLVRRPTLRRPSRSHHQAL